MADTTVTEFPNPTLDTRNLGLQGPYWIDTQKAVIVYVDAGSAMEIRRTVDGGSTWARIDLEAGAARNFACWFDQETPEDNGTLVNIAWLDSTDNEAKYCNIDVSDGTLGTVRTIDSGLTISTTEPENRIAITKTVSGNIIAAFSTQTEIECYKSDDLFATSPTSIADPFETATEEDWLLLYPANTGDDNDACGIFWDRSSNTVSMKMYDDSEDDWTESAVGGIGGAMDSSTYINMDAAVRHSDNHILLALHTFPDNVLDDLRTYDITPDSISSPTSTTKTRIFIDQAESAQVSVLINQQNDDVYVAHLKGGTWLSSTDVVFHKSDDGMGTWGSEQAYSEATADDNRLVHGGRTIGDSGGRVQWTWYNDDLTDIFVNLVNDIEISATGGGGTNLQLNIGDDWKSVDGMQINIGDAWKAIAGAQVNIGDSWEPIF